MASNTVGGLVVGHVFALVVIFLVAWGVSSLGAPVAALAALKKPIFWGLVLVGAGLCAALGAVRGAQQKAAQAQSAQVTEAPRS